MIMVRLQESDGTKKKKALDGNLINTRSFGSRPYPGLVL